MPPSHDLSNARRSGLTRGARASGPTRLLKLLLGLALVAVFIAGSGCHKIFGEFDVDSRWNARGPTLCQAGGVRCNEEYLLSCGDDLNSWDLVDTCATPDRCDSIDGTCNVCEPASLRCNGPWREECAPDGSRWIPLEECEAAAMCNPTSCGQCPSAGEVDCVAANPDDPAAMATELVQCTPGLGWQPLDSCDSEVLCERTVDIAMSDMANFLGVCMEPVCEAPGELRCQDNRLERCSQGRQMWNLVDTCDTAAVCQLRLQEAQDPAVAAMVTMCDAPCGPAGSFRCDGQQLLRCRDDQTGEDELTVCPEGRTCDPVVGDCRGPCSPGDYRCNAAALEVCNANEEWELSEECATRALCSVTTNEETGVTEGSCLPVACEPADTYQCDGERLLRCNDDQTAWVEEEICESAELCDATSERCRTPICPADGAFSCTASNLRQVCASGRSQWLDVEQCPADSTCNNDPAGGPNCLTECPDNPYDCFGNIRRVCDDSSGVATFTADRTCNTRELCQCALNGTCEVLSEDGKCGQPICGENLPDFNCDGSVLQACAAGRDAWVDQTDCGSSDLCDTGMGGNDGACLACPIAGEVQCFNSGASRRTCSADRSEWTSQQTCSFGCVDNGTADYCAVCFADELRCDGTNDLDICSMDRRSLVDQQDCPFTCLQNGNSDRCAPCASGERRCNGSTELQQCSADLTRLTHLEDCEFSCINMGQSDFCGTCDEGDKQCNGSSLQTCTNGVWGSGSACMHACIVNDSGPDACAAECAPGVRECVSSGGAVRECAANGTWQASVTCDITCINSGTLDFCAPQCAPGETECATQSSVRTCNAQTGTWVSETMTCGTGTPVCYDGSCVQCDPGNYTNRCSSTTAMQSCSMAGNVVTTNCSGTTPVCSTISGVGRCTECSPGATQCQADGTLRTCGSNGTWSTTTCATDKVCNVINNVAACRDCALGDTECAGAKTFRSCTSQGTWSDATACPLNANCSNDRCEECQTGAKECVGKSGNIRSCVAGAWDSATSCTNGCYGSYPDAQCGSCTAGAKQCSGGSTPVPQLCTGGQWVDQAACTGGDVCSAGNCVDCVGTGTQCNGDTLQRCSSNTWVDEDTCGFGCGGNPPACFACESGSTQCMNDGGSVGQLQTCTSGQWGMASACSSPSRSCAGNACGVCLNGAKRCDSGGSALETCASGAWSSMSCTGVCAVIGSAAACVACNPANHPPTCTDDSMGVGQLTTCSATGSLSTSACPGGVSCSTASMCGECTNGDIDSMCHSTTSQRECVAGEWVEKPCPAGDTCSSGTCMAPPTTTGGGTGGTSSTGTTSSTGGGTSTTSSTASTGTSG